MPLRVYPMGPEVFNLDRDDCHYCAIWAEKNHFSINHPGQQPVPPTPFGIFERCLEFILDSDVAIVDLSPFRGAYPDVGTCHEVGALAMWNRLHPDKKKLALGYTLSPVDPHAAYGGVRRLPSGLSVDANNYFIDPNPWNIMIYQTILTSGGQFFHGQRDEVFPKMASAIKEHAATLDPQP